MSAGEYPYGRDLPWGWWLLDHGGHLRDAEGGTWKDVREAFWVGRLGMAPAHVAAEQQEQMLRVLNGVDARWLGACETRDALFRGDTFAWRFYMGWLGSVGMLDIKAPWSSFDSPLSDEGRAVMLMLRATREPAWVDLPFSTFIDAIATESLGEADHSREQALRAFERGVSPGPHVFGRDRVGRMWMVTLTSIDPTARLPLRKVAWSCSFEDVRMRDDLFGWIALRVHSWQDWGDLVRSKGASALTSLLLSLLVADRLATRGSDERPGERSGVRWTGGLD